MLYVLHDSTLKFVPTVRLINSLNSQKGSRTGNAGNNLEYQVLTLMQNVP
ncbi:uncharacterized protein LOC134834689 [Culicoides brevitarsis]